MARFTAEVDVAAPVDRVWARVTDWPAHGRWIPFTTVTVTSPQPGGVGATFTGRTALGPVGFDDPMVIVDWSPPVAGSAGHCAVRKLGRVVLGRAWLEVSPSATGSRVRWTEDVQIAPVRLTHWLDPLIAAGGRIGFRRALHGLLDDLAATADDRR